LDKALKLLQADQGLLFVLLDHNMLGRDGAACLESIKSARPEAIIVGTGDHDVQAHFAALGVDRVVRRPWRVKDLINVITGRIGDCLECGLPLPLRRPQPNEQAGSWRCTHCGTPYQAVIDDSFPADVLRNVRSP
jgi:hypothetical protein